MHPCILENNEQKNILQMNMSFSDDYVKHIFDKSVCDTENSCDVMYSETSLRGLQKVFFSHVVNTQLLCKWDLYTYT